MVRVCSCIIPEITSNVPSNFLPPVPCALISAGILLPLGLRAGASDSFRFAHTQTSDKSDNTNSSFPDSTYSPVFTCPSSTVPLRGALTAITPVTLFVAEFARSSSSLLESPDRVSRVRALASSISASACRVLASCISTSADIFFAKRFASRSAVFRASCKIAIFFKKSALASATSGLSISKRTSPAETFWPMLTIVPRTRPACGWKYGPFLSRSAVLHR